MKPGKNVYDAEEAEEDSRHDPPARSDAIEEHGEEKRERRPEVVHHRHFHRLRAAGGKEDRKAEAERGGICGRKADEEVALVDLPEVGDPDREKEADCRREVEKRLPLREAEPFGNAANE